MYQTFDSVSKARAARHEMISSHGASIYPKHREGVTQNVETTSSADGNDSGMSKSTESEHNYELGIIAPIVIVGLIFMLSLKFLPVSMK